ncbi:MAG: outer membrane protein assembly factor BamE domain-containing protein [Chthoniobacterales bacterium]
MKMSARSLRFLALIACALVGLTSCDSRRLRKANVDEVDKGMAKKQVESILGPPTTIDTKDFATLKKTIYIYLQGKDTVTVTFKDDKVESKESTLND